MSERVRCVIVPVCASIEGTFGKDAGVMSFLLRTYVTFDVCICVEVVFCKVVHNW